eukprot:10870956-Alexandrium_andersonii.AAC.1
MPAGFRHRVRLWRASPLRVARVVARAGRNARTVGAVEAGGAQEVRSRSFVAWPTCRRTGGPRSRRTEVAISCSCLLYTSPSPRD